MLDFVFGFWQRCPLRVLAFFITSSFLIERFEFSDLFRRFVAHPLGFRQLLVYVGKLLALFAIFLEIVAVFSFNGFKQTYLFCGFRALPRCRLQCACDLRITAQGECLLRLPLFSNENLPQVLGVSIVHSCGQPLFRLVIFKNLGCRRVDGDDCAGVLGATKDLVQRKFVAVKLQPELNLRLFLAGVTVQTKRFA